MIVFRHSFAFRYATPLAVTLPPFSLMPPIFHFAIVSLRQLAFLFADFIGRHYIFFFLSILTFSILELPPAYAIALRQPRCQR
jgi:hypothetical protein